VRLHLDDQTLAGVVYGSQGFRRFPVSAAA
jgi:hypothetical protein